jgi:hypothetical protein
MRGEQVEAAPCPTPRTQRSRGHSRFQKRHTAQIHSRLQLKNVNDEERLTYGVRRFATICIRLHSLAIACARLQRLAIGRRRRRTIEWLTIRVRHARSLQPVAARYRHSTHNATEGHQSRLEEATRDPAALLGPATINTSLGVAPGLTRRSCH